MNLWFYLFLFNVEVGMLVADRVLEFNINPRDLAHFECKRN